MGNNDIYCIECGKEIPTEQMKSCPWCGEAVIYWCDNCGGPITDDMRYCPWCMNDFGKKKNVTTPESNDGEPFCSHCDGPITKNMLNCPWCGLEFIETVSAKPPKAKAGESCCAECEGRIQD